MEGFISPPKFLFLEGGLTIPGVEGIKNTRRINLKSVVEVSSPILFVVRSALFPAKAITMLGLAWNKSIDNLILIFKYDHCSLLPAAEAPSPRFLLAQMCLRVE